uniref:ubiquitinyl hydrolase 1 n=1 Tax=Salarias fasciatus TaxID=181472 RepID=A0A672H2B1_SALFA
MTQQCFFREVLGDGVPPKVAEGDKVNYERFRTWLLQNKEAFTLSRWLLSGGVCVTLTDDSDTPTFYQTLAGVTHLEESDIIDLEKRYWLLKAQSRTGRFDLETFVPLVSPPIHASLSEVCFKVFDVDRDGVLSRDELHEMVVALLEVWKDNRTDTLPLGHLTLEDYQIWSVKSALANEFLNLLFQVCHIVLGLRPATPEEEGQIISRGWLERESRHGLQQGQNWFLISMLWWQQWKDYVKYVRIVVEQPSILGSLRAPMAAVEPAPPDRLGVLGGFDPSSPAEERSPDAVSSASEATETGRFTPPQAAPSATESCFARQHNVSDNNNQCFSGANGHLPSQLAAQRPGAIDNQPLVNTETSQHPLHPPRRSLQPASSRDFETVPEPVWRALYHWYGANLSLPRPVIVDSVTGQAELELFPRYLLFLRQQPASRSPQSNIWVNMGNVPSPNAPLKRMLAYTGCFSRMATIKDIHLYLSQRLRIKEEDMRLWLYNSENYLTLLDDEDHTLEGLKILDEQQLVIEVRNKDMSWPEEMSFIANSSKMDRHKVPTEKGATGLSNLGNTCFMNSSIQCVSNTKPLTDYFISGRHLYELNRTNPIGMRGHMAKCYGDLVMELWSGTQKNVAPLKLRWTIAKYAPRFNGFQQQDSQELLAFLLDGLHEDLNRVHEKPYVELKDSDGRPDWEVASEAWENHLRRNRSIVVDLFHGQLKSQVKCKTCGHISARFDPFNFLSLPLPMDSSMHLEITVIKLDGSTPVRFGLRLNMDEKYTGLKKQLSELCSLKPEQILLAEVHASNIKNFPQDNQKVRLSVNGFLCAFEVPVPGSPTSLSSPTLTGDGAPCSRCVTNITPVANGSAANGHLGNAPALIPNGGPGAAVPGSPEAPLANGVANGHVTPPQDSPFIGYIIAMHRKMMRTELYFLSAQKNRPSLFGMPLIVPCTVHTSKKDLYDAVWIQVSRLASPLPPQEASNHAQDCDDSMGYQYPFTLRVVGKDGNACAWCPWYRFCRGCTIECTEDRASVGNAYIAVDWDPTALHLRYQTSQERIVEEHCSVEQSRRAQAEPISLDSCLRAFTGEEELGEDELYYCSKCQTHRLATKKLDLWRLPPILIVHLKRFQFVNGRWIKSQKIVKFPRGSFDPSAFLAPRDLEQYRLQSRSESEDLLRAGEDHLSSVSAPAGFCNLPKASPASGRKSAPSLSRTSSPSGSPKGGGGRRPGRLRLPQLGSRHRLSNSKESLEGSEGEGGAAAPGAPGESAASEWSCGSSEASSSHCDVTLLNGETNGLSSDCSTESGVEPDGPPPPLHRDSTALDAIYNLYAISCHSGIMGGGHYVTYARNPNHKWYCYNDSSCKEVHSEEIDTDSAYILFYEQQGVDYSQFLPKIDGKKMADTSSMDEDFESDYKKYCVLQ